MDAKDSVISGNAQASVGSTYTVGIDKGFLIVAYPDSDVDSEFGFEFWATAVLKSEDDDSGDSAGVPVVVVNDSGSGKIVIEKQNEDG